ncbi:50S ribosomal protein L13 [Candidatus Uhrbacteria bacterium]|nr:50S ribosomal protein L13 [Candidatus Uhrbacteria bacterium]
MQAPERQQHTIDADGKTFGRLATSIVLLLRGKQKPTFTPHIDAGDFVHVVNLRAVRWTGKKMTDKKYYRSSSYPGNLKTQTLRERWERHPDDVLRDAVYNMLPVNRLRAQIIKRLRVDF